MQFNISNTKQRLSAEVMRSFSSVRQRSCLEWSVFFWPPDFSCQVRLNNDLTMFKESNEFLPFQGVNMKKCWIKRQIYLKFF